MLSFLFHTYIACTCKLDPVTDMGCLIYFSLRVLLHKSGTKESSGGQSHQLNSNDSEPSRCLVRQVVKGSLTKLEENSVVPERSIRLELGSCWLQYLQKQETLTDTTSNGLGRDHEAEPAVKGLGKHFKCLKKRDKKPSNSSSKVGKEENDCEPCSMNQSIGESRNEMELKNLISKEAFSRLEESRTGLHLKVSSSLFHVFSQKVWHRFTTMVLFSLF